MTDEYSGFDGDTFANEGVAADFAAFADFRALLNFDKCTDPRFIANLTAIKVDESVDAHIATEFHIWRNSPVVGRLVIHSAVVTFEPFLWTASVLQSKSSGGIGRM